MTKTANQLKIATLNVVSLIARKRKEWLLDLLLQEKIDIMLLQETKIFSPETAKSFVAFFGNHFWCHYTMTDARSGGTAVLIRKSKTITVIECELSADGRFTVVDCLVEEELTRLISVYAPNLTEERKTFFEDLQHLVDTPGRVILGGDFNCVLSRKDRLPARDIRDSSTVVLKRLLHDFDLVDVTEGFPDFSPRFTRWGGASQARLDRLYISGQLSRGILSYEATPISFSDHAVVSVKIPTRTPKKAGQTQWKLNAAALEDELFCKQIVEMFQCLFGGGAPDACQWENFKIEIKELAVRYGKNKAQRKKAEMAALTDTLKLFVMEEERAPGQFTEDIKATKNSMLRLLGEKHWGALVRSREQRVEHELQPSKVFCAFERDRAKKMSVSELVLDKGPTGEHREIVAAFEKYYADLLRKKSPAVPIPKEILNILPKIPEDTRDFINGPITPSEVERAIKTLSKNKSPGPDGIGNSFYRTFTGVLCPLLAEVFEDIITRKLLPPSMRKSNVVLIPKKLPADGPPGVADFRPISLLNSDYKILAKIIGRRLESGLGHVIGEHQTCGLKGRSIARNIHTMRIIAEAAETGQGSPIAVMKIDFSKAFDRVDRDYLFALLRHIGVGEKMEQLLNICYADTSMNLLIDGTTSRTIKIERSVRQGCPLSPMLFALYLEPLCRSLLTNPTITGFRLGETETKVIAYADDVAVLCSSQEQVELVLGELRLFAGFSGAVLNQRKSQGSWLGEWRSKPRLFQGMTWAEDVDGYLGIDLNLREPATCRWTRRVAILGSKLFPWRQRHIPLTTRSYICNSVSYPAVLYAAQVMPFPGRTANDIHRTWATFVWRSTYEPMRRTNLFWNIDRGGLGLINTKVKLMVQRFLLFRDSRDPLMRIAFHALGDHYLSRWQVPATTATGGSRVLSFYSEMASAISQLERLFSWEYLLTVKRVALYWATVEALLPFPIYRSPGVDGGKSDVLRRIRSMPVPTATRDVFFRFHAGILPVKTRQADRGFFVPWSTGCHLCGRPETSEHVFAECGNAVFLWAELQDFYKIEIDTSYEALRFLKCSTTAEAKEITDIVVTLAVHALWRTRVDVVECALHPRPAWRHFINKAEWTVSVLHAREDSRDLGDVIARGCARARQFYGRQADRQRLPRRR